MNPCDRHDGRRGQADRNNRQHEPIVERLLRQEILLEAERVLRLVLALGMTGRFRLDRLRAGRSAHRRQKKHQGNGKGGWRFHGDHHTAGAAGTLKLRREKQARSGETGGIGPQAAGRHAPV